MSDQDGCLFCGILSFLVQNSALCRVASNIEAATESFRYFTGATGYTCRIW